jgi:hypothetical protein
MPTRVIQASVIDRHLDSAARRELLVGNGGYCLAFSLDPLRQTIAQGTDRQDGTGASATSCTGVSPVLLP